jgi:hypothetical protein
MMTWVISRITPVKRQRVTYLVIDAQTYAEGRHDIRVEDGVIVQAHAIPTIQKLVQSTTGTRCYMGDVSIVVDDEYDGETNYWEITNV